MPRWTDEGIVLSADPLGENSALLTCFTADHGLAKGVVKGARRKAAYLQAGNRLSLTWSARLEEHLGTWTLEPLSSVGSCLLNQPLALAALSSALSLTGTVLPEREPQKEVFHQILSLLESFMDVPNPSLDPSSASVSLGLPLVPCGGAKYLQSCHWYNGYTTYEVVLLKAAGFRLSLGQCVATGTTENLVYVSPRSGGAVSFDAGAPYKNKLLTLPPYLLTGNRAKENEFFDALCLTEYFFDRYILEQVNTGLPAARNRFKDMIQKRQLNLRKS